MKKIIFTNTMDGIVSNEYYPKPSSKLVPEWYKKTQSYMNNEKTLSLSGQTTGTIKKCMPVFDAITSGYIIPTYCDLIVKKEPSTGEPLYISSIGNSVEFHDVIQAPYHPYMNGHRYPKWINPWAIKTPAGYSCLFIPPVHGGNNYFTIADGIVDTDRYKSPINFPFVLKDINFEGLIPAGTPMVQIIPFKRDSWESIVGTKDEIDNVKDVNSLLESKFFDRYKTLFWNKKEYR